MSPKPTCGGTGMRPISLSVRGLILLTAIGMLAACNASPDDNLLKASRDGDLAAVKAALAAKANVNVQDASGDTPLVGASAWCNLAVVKALIAAGADVNEKQRDTANNLNTGGTALMAAAGGDHPDCPQIIETLIAAGADVNARDAQGLTAMSDAAIEGQLEAAKLLVAAGAPVNGRPGDLETPLELTTGPTPGMASASGRAAVAQFLRQQGGRGRTALMRPS